MRLELDQGGLDGFALDVVAVVRRLGEQGVDPLALRHRLGADGQRGQVTVGCDVVQGLFMQLIGVEESLQAGQLLGEGHRTATLRELVRLDFSPVNAASARAAGFFSMRWTSAAAASRSRILRDFHLAAAADLPFTGFPCSNRLSAFSRTSSATTISVVSRGRSSSVWPAAATPWC
ncbi:hypothetical protein D9M69_573970 [compost metagenome]